MAGIAGFLVQKHRGPDARRNEPVGAAKIAAIGPRLI